MSEDQNQNIETSASEFHPSEASAKAGNRQQANNTNTTQNSNQQATATTQDLNNPLAAKVLELEAALNEAQSKTEEMTKAAQIALADLQNFKRRTEEERSKFAKMASADLVYELIPHLDNFQRAFEHAPQGEGKEWADSIQSIFTQLQKSLESKGLQKIETIGQKLDTSKHEALLQGPGEKDIITEELEPGYSLGDFIIKPAKVKVGNGE